MNKYTIYIYIDLPVFWLSSLKPMAYTLFWTSISQLVVLDTHLRYYAKRFEFVASMFKQVRDRFWHVFIDVGSLIGSILIDVLCCLHIVFANMDCSLLVLFFVFVHGSLEPRCSKCYVLRWKKNSSLKPPFLYPFWHRFGNNFHVCSQ